jgi:serine/threonine protein kinase
MDVSNGLKYFEKNNLLHKDIKLDNILVSKNMKSKIGVVLSLFYFLFEFYKLTIRRSWTSNSIRKKYIIYFVYEVIM